MSNTMVATHEQPSAAIDWAELRALYVKGLPLIDISRQTGIPIGTIKARSSREKWATTVALAEQHVQRLATEELSDSATRWLGRIDKLVHSTLDNVESKDVRKLSLRDLQLVLDCAEKANRVARATYGLDAENKSQPKVTVNVAVLDQQRNRLPTALKEYVDVETVESTSDAQT